jgi:hypothetical protein
MTKEEKIEKAVEAFDAKQGAFTGSTREGITAAYPILAEIDEPTEKELYRADNMHFIYPSDALIDFVRNRNAALQEKKDPRVSVVEKFFRDWCDVAADDQTRAVSLLERLDLLEKGVSRHGR